MFAHGKVKDNKIFTFKSHLNARRWLTATPNALSQEQDNEGQRERSAMGVLTWKLELYRLITSGCADHIINNNKKAQLRAL